MVDKQTPGLRPGLGWSGWRNAAGPVEVREQLELHCLQAVLKEGIDQGRDIEDLGEI